MTLVAYSPLCQGLLTGVCMKERVDEVGWVGRGCMNDREWTIPQYVTAVPMLSVSRINAGAILLVSELLTPYSGEVRHRSEGRGTPGPFDNCVTPV